MQLTKFTDYALRTLMALATLPEGKVANISTLSQQFSISENHLVKVVHSLAKLGFIRTQRGVGGGMYLQPNTLQIPLGILISQLETTISPVDCDHPVCPLRGQCKLKSLLDQAMQAFFSTLNSASLADLMADSTTRAGLYQVIQWR
jgi:Rrf2 family transcriptional regulator, nitric oxide-sensitive transcriptional repressor